MAELLKNIYNETFFNRLSASLAHVFPSFDTNSFFSYIYDTTWEDKELKQRTRHISSGLHQHLSGNYSSDIKTLLKLIPVLKENGFNEGSLEFIFLPDFVELFGLDHFETSFEALEEITQFITCEFGIRPFILKYPEKSILKMTEWSKHKHASVRRLASEGSRPRLPWSMALPFLKKDPSPILSLLDNLKSDDSEYVRRSVANNLNDISKDHPELVITLVKRWKGLSTETDQLIKHASRTLLKQGNPELMQLFGFGGIENLSVSKFAVLTPTVQIDGGMEFSFTLENKSEEDIKVRIEYGLYYQKANGTLSKKVFKISEKTYTASSTTPIERRQHFKQITTRKYHPGLHQVSLIINGVELEKLDFTLIKK